MLRLLCIAGAYAAAVYIAENTLGNAGFPLYLWYFERIPAWQWSLPVHGAGFIWIAAWTYALRRRQTTLSILVSWAFFAAAEMLNIFRLKLFDYSSKPFGIDFSLAAVLALYAILCVVAVYALRIWVFCTRSAYS